MTDSNYSVLGITLSVVGGLLILVEGGLLAALGAAVSSTPGGGGLGSEAGTLIGGIGLIGVVLGFVVIILAVWSIFWFEANKPMGIGIIVISIASLVVGGGFVVGTILGIGGGILVFQCENEPDELPEGPRGEPGSDALHFNCPACFAPYSAGTRVCERCGARDPVVRDSFLRTSSP